MRMRRLLMSVVALVVALVAAPLTASASYALPLCRGVTNFELTNGWADVPTTSSRSYNRSCYLEESGSYSEAVKTLQYHLRNAEQHWAVDVDGYFGRITKGAVRSVQFKYGKTTDGVYGPDTGRAMTWYGGWWRYGKWR